MSHFSTLVIVEGPVTRETAQDRVAPLLAPYDENGHWFKDGSKWDWWQIGGRWTGALSGYDPEADPLNIEICDLCNGSGTRNDKIAKQLRSTNPSFTCNGCRGKGERGVWPTRRHEHDGDVMRVADIRSDFTPFAIVTPDGRWFDSGSMGWFGVKQEDTMSKEAWEDQWKQIRAAFPDHVGVIVDCHV